MGIPMVVKMDTMFTGVLNTPTMCLAMRDVLYAYDQVRRTLFLRSENVTDNMLRAACIYFELWDSPLDIRAYRDS